MHFISLRADLGHVNITIDKPVGFFVWLVGFVCVCVSIYLFIYFPLSGNSDQPNFVGEGKDSDETTKFKVFVFSLKYL